MKTSLHAKKIRLILGIFAILVNICPAVGQNPFENLSVYQNTIYPDDQRVITPVESIPSGGIKAAAGSIAVNENALYNTYSPAQLVQNILVSGCITASNITFSGGFNVGDPNRRQLGYFEMASSTFPINEGLVLSSGYVTSSEGPNNATGSSNALGLAGDPDLTLLASAASHDAAVLQFDFIPSGNLLEFQYIFSSEEYLEYCCSAFNDAFGFFLSGPGITGPFSNSSVNIALLPSSVIPVAINNVHSFVASNAYGNPCPAQNDIYYISNPPGTLSTQFDGMTVVLTATYNVTRCATYHIKLAVGDIADDKLNSAVFLKARSFSSSPPLITCPNDTLIECGTSILPASTGIADVTDNCVIVNLAYTDAITNGSCTGNHTILRTWTVTDLCGGTASCDQTITIEDHTPPVWTSAPGSLNTTVECSNIAAMTAALALMPVASDLCSSVITGGPSQVITPGSCPGNYIITRTWTLADDCGNLGVDFIQIITVVDNIGPLWNQTAGSLDVTVACDNPAALAAALALAPTASDICGAISLTGPVVTNIPGTCPANYIIMRTWNATDACSNMTSFIQAITVQDINPPILSGVPVNTTVECDAVPAPALVTATDNCGPNPAVTMTQSTTAGSCNNSYTITRTWTATDLCNNLTSATQIITVQDNTAPIIISCSLPQSSGANALCVATVPDFTASVTATDNCTSTGTLIITQSPVAGTITGLGITTVTITVTDECNNQATCTTTFSVTLGPAPVIITEPSDQAICLGANAAFSVTASGTGLLNYQWQENTGSGWNNLINGGVYSGTGSATLNLTSPPFSMNGYQYQCIISTCGLQVITQTVTLTINSNFSPGIASSDQTICFNTTPLPLSSTPPTGGSGSYTYQWQQSTDNATFFNIPGATTLSYSPPALSQTTYFHLIQTSGSGCGIVITNVVRITVYPILSAGSASADQTICFNTAPAPLIATLATGGDGTYLFQWQISTDNSSFINISGANGLTYFPGLLTQTTYFRLSQTSGSTCGTVFTNSIQIFVHPVLSAGIASANQNICFNTIPSAINSTPPSGGDGTYSYQWQISTDNILFVNIPGANALSYSPGTLTQTTYFRLEQTSGSGCGSVFTNVVIINVNPVLNAGIATANQTICYNSVPSAISANSPSGGSGSYTYQWQISTDNVIFTDIPGATLLSFSPGNLIQTTFYRLKQISGGGCGTVITNTVTITVLPDLAPGSASADQTICYNGIPAPLNATLPTGGDGTYTFQWQTSTDNSTFSNIPGANGLSYAPGALTQSTYFRLLQTSGSGCGTVNTNSVFILVPPRLTAGIASFNQNICFNSVPAAISATPPTGGDGTYSYQWQVSTDNVVFVNIPGATTLSYSPGSLSQTTYYLLVQTSGSGCGFVTTNVVTISVNPILIPGIAAADQTICYNSAPSAINASLPSGGNGTYTYQWQESTDNILFVDIPGATNLSYSPGNLILTTFYRLRQISGGGCGIVTTNVIRILVNPNLVAGVVSADQTICYNTAPAALNSTPPTGGNGTYSYQWQVSTDNIIYTDVPGANSTSYSPGVLLQTTYYRLSQISGGGCGSVNTNAVSILVRPILSAGIATADQLICTNSAPSPINASPPSGGDGIYTYQWQVSTDNVLFSNIPGANALSYSPGVLAQTTYYRQQQTSGSGCGTVTTNTVIVTFNLNPTVTDILTPICSDSPTGVIFNALPGAPAASYNIININSNGLISSAGNPGNGNGFAANVIADDAWTNPTANQINVVYTVIPVSPAGCLGNAFTATIQVLGEPIVASQSKTLCSDISSGVILGPSSSVAATSYNIVGINNSGMTASAGNPVIGAGFGANVLVDDAWTNTGTSAIDVIYSIIPVSGAGCAGDLFTITLTISPGPVVDDQVVGQSTCSGTSSGIILGQGNNIPVASYNIVSINSNGLSASAGNPVTGTGFANDVIADDVWENQTSNEVNVIYTVVPVGILGCTGNPFIVIIQVQPQPIIDFTTTNTCWGDTTFFTLSGTNINSISLWHWDFGDGTFWNCNSPGCGSEPHVFPFNGTYPVTLHVTDTNGCEYEVTHPVIIVLRPVAFFSYDTPDCLGSPIQFTDLSTCPADPVFTYIKQWVWDFGDGTPPQTILFQADPNILHSYTGTGIYQVTLTITNSHGCTDSFSTNITVTDRPVADFIYSGICEDATSFFQDASSENGGGEIIGWNWNFGDPTSGINNLSDLQNPSHIFASSGNFVVTLVVINFNGCSDTVLYAVNVKVAPDASFSSSIGCIGTPTLFTANLLLTNAGSIASCMWDFGDGNTGNTPSASNNYAAPGNYIVQLTITDTAGCEGVYTDTIKVSQPPFAHFSVNMLNCIGESVEFSNLSTSADGYITGWNWDFGDGTSQAVIFPANANVSHNYSLNGSFLVTLTVTTSEGCTDSEQILVTMTPGPIAMFGYQGGCLSDPVNFTDNSLVIGSTAITSWSWNFGDPGSGISNLSNQQNPSHTYTATGTYNVQLIISTANSCSDTLVRNVVVRPLPLVDFLVQGVCQNNPVQFTPDAAAMNMNTIATWFWQFGDGATSTSINPTHTYTIAGNYTITLHATDTSGCSNSVIRQLQIKSLPLVNFNFTAPTCQQSIVHFDDLSTIQDAYVVQWTWDFGDGTSQTINFPNISSVDHAYSNAGLFNVTLTLKTNDSCTNQAVKTVTILAKPTAQFIHSPGCKDLAVSFTDQSQGSPGFGISSRLWNFGDAASGMSNTSILSNPIHIYNTAGIYSVKLIVNTINGCSDTVTQNVTVAPVPVVNFSSQPSCNGDTTNFTSSTFVNATTTGWIWQFGDGTSSSSADPGHIYGQSGIYTVTLTITDSTGCSNTISKQVIIPPKPYANFSSNAPGCAGLPVTFTDLTNPNGGIISSWHMDFGDATDTTLATVPVNIFHTYSGFGSFIVTLTVQAQSGCSDLIQRTITISPSPIASFNYTNTCQSEPTQFTNLSTLNGGTGLIGFQWNFGDPASGTGNTSNLQNPAHNYTTSGTFIATLIVTNAAGCFDSVQSQVFILPKPAVGFITDGITCLGTSTFFHTDTTITNLGAVQTLDWIFGDGTPNSSQQNPIHTYSDAGTFSVTLSITDTIGCSNSFTQEITVHALPTAGFSYSYSCEDSETQFTDESIAPAGETIIAWEWDFGDETSLMPTSTLQNPVHTYSNPGSYNVTETVYTENGCSHSIILNIKIWPSPTAHFNYSVTPCSNGEVQFQDSSYTYQSTITNLSWEFEPYQYSSGQSPVHQFYNVDSSYFVKLIATNSRGCVDTIVQEVDVPASLAISFSHELTCFGNQTIFTPVVNTPTGDSLLTFSWNFGNPQSGTANVSNLKEPSHLFTNPGFFSVYLTSTDIYGCSATTSKTVEVKNIPAASFTYLPGLCDNKIHFTSTSFDPSSQITAYIWNYGDGITDTIAAPAITATHQYAVAGTYDVTLKAVNLNGCAGTITNTVQRDACLVSAFAQPDTLRCQNNAVTFSDLSTCGGTISEWKWNWGDGSQPTVYNIFKQRVTHVFSHPGNYNVSLQVTTLAGGSSLTDAMTVKINILASPLAGFTAANVCLGEKAVFHNTSNENGATRVDYIWDFGDIHSIGDTSILENPEYAYSSIGIYDARLIAINQSGCADTVISPIITGGLPKAAFDYGLSCPGRPTQFIDHSDSSMVPITKWEWMVSDSAKQGYISGKNAIFAFDQQGTYNVLLRVTDANGCTDTVTQKIIVNPGPVSAFSITENYGQEQGNLNLVNGTIDATMYHWDFGNGTTSSEESPVTKYTEEGTYVISLRAENSFGCIDTTSTTFKFMYKGLFIPNAFSPTGSCNEVRFFKPAGINLRTYRIEVYNSHGNVIWSSKLLDEEGAPVEQWDGTYKNNMCQQDVYVWKVRATFRDGSIWNNDDAGVRGMLESGQVFGTVSLIR